jgi:hypothetical protein
LWTIASLALYKKIELKKENPDMEESPTKHRVVAYINDRLSLSFGVYLDKDWPIICVSFGALYIPGCLSAVQGIQVRQSLAVPDCSSVTECHL